MSLRDFASASDDELAPVGSFEAYQAIAEAMHFNVLGCAPDADVADFREDPGTLEQRLWIKKLDWTVPEDETKPCWWIVNPNDEKTSPPRLLSRSLVCLRLELSATRCATSGKLRVEWEKRLLDNTNAVAALKDHRSLWHSVDGPEPDALMQPTPAGLEAAKQAATTLRQLMTSGATTLI